MARKATKTSKKKQEKDTIAIDRNVQDIQKAEEMPAKSEIETASGCRPEDLERPADIYVKEETAAEMGKRLQEVADKYREEIKETSDPDELKKIEDEWVAKLEMMDKYIERVKYFLPESVVFRGVNYQKHAVASKIVRFLSKKEVQWQYTLGMYELCKFWISDPSEISYGAYDSTLRTLGDCTFTGMKEWEDILIINEYFRQSNTDYAKDMTAYQYLSTMHSHVIDQMGLSTPVSSTSGETQNI